MFRLGVLVASVVAVGPAWAGAAASRTPASNIESVPFNGDRDVAIPANGSDSCAGAAAISGYRTWGFDLAGATTDGLAHSVCLSFGSDQIWRDRWWAWTAPATGLTTVETCGLTITDTRIAVYAPASPCPPTGEYLVACNDDFCSVQTSLTFIAQAGQTYFIRLGRYGTTEPAAAGSGAFRIIASLTPDVCPDDAGPCQTVLLSATAFTSNGSFRCADDIVPSASGAIEGVCWWGSYPSTAAAADDFTVTYWTNAGGLPGIPIASFSQSGSLAVQRVATNDLDIAGTTMFLYSATHAPVPVVKNTRYWVEVRNMFGGTWYWQGSVQGNGGWQDQTPPSNWGDATARPNFAFCPVYNSACNLDTNGDGQINFADLNNIISSFNTSCP